MRFLVFVIAALLALAAPAMAQQQDGQIDLRALTEKTVLPSPGVSSDEIDLRALAEKTVPFPPWPGVSSGYGCHCDDQHQDGQDHKQQSCQDGDGF